MAQQPPGAAAMRFALGGLALGLALGVGLTSLFLSTPKSPQPQEPYLVAKALSFHNLKGWRQGQVRFAAALTAFGRSCEKILSRPPGAAVNPGEALGQKTKLATLSGTREDWAVPCEALPEGAVTDAAAKAFFEAHFQPVRVVDRRAGRKGLFTGYFEPTYPARRTQEGRFTAPVLTRPDDLVSATLGVFSAQFQGETIWGRIDGRRLVPYADHRGILEAPPPSSDILGYMDPNDLLTMQIQGSGRLVFADGTSRRVGYAGKNGHPYVAVGRTLVEQGELALEEVTMPAILAWLAAAPAEAAAEVRYSNPSYVFFTAREDLPDPDLGPVGAQGIQLAAGVSLAVDHRFYAYGTPVWVTTPKSGVNPPLATLFIAQDTGGAIRGAQRGDVFFGGGPQAAEQAGTMKAMGQMIILLPKSVVKQKRQPHAPA